MHTHSCMQGKTGREGKLNDQQLMSPDFRDNIPMPPPFPPFILNETNFMQAFVT